MADKGLAWLSKNVFENRLIQITYPGTGNNSHGSSSLNLTLFRTYNPGLSRWMSRDPLGESGGSNLYQYAFNNPLNFFDPLGDRPIPASSNFSGKPSQTTSPSGVGAISAEGHPGQLYGPNVGFSKGEPLPISKLAKHAKKPLTDLAACHSSEPKPGSKDSKTSTAGQLAQTAKTFVIGYEGTVWPSTEASYQTGPYNVGIKIPTKASLFDPPGKPVATYSTPESPADWANAQGIAAKYFSK